MSKLATALDTVRHQGLSGLWLGIRRNLRSHMTTYLFARHWDIERDGPIEEDDRFDCRLATPADFEGIARACPPEVWLGSDPVLLRAGIRERFDMGWECFVASKGDTVVGAVWQQPWMYDEILPPERRGAVARESRNIFVTTKARRRGIAELLMRYTMDAMARRGSAVTYARVLPDRRASVALHEKLGFDNLGLMTIRITLGRKSCQLRKAT